jgi:sugar lactone lactonase YvrE
VTRPTARALVGAAATLALLTTGPALAADGDDRGNRGKGGERAARTTTYALPGQDVFPEGVDTFGRYFYVTSTTDGTVFRGVIGRDEVAEVFLPGGEDGRTMAVGIEATEDLLLVAGGITGELFVYDRQTGEFLGAHSNGLTSGTFINDVAVAPNGDVYVTDSAQDVVYRVPTDEVGEGSPLEVFASFAGVDPRGPFNANGIVVTNNGEYLVVVQSDTGALYRVSTDNGDIRRIDVGGADLTAGDGLELQGLTLYVVRNSVELIAEVRLDGRLRSGRVVEQVTDPSFMFPTTAALDRGRLLVVNSQFDQRGGDPEEPFTVSSIKRP